jgi:hypothetical protein
MRRSSSNNKNILLTLTSIAVIALFIITGMNTAIAIDQSREFVRDEVPTESPVEKTIIKETIVEETKEVVTEEAESGCSICNSGNDVAPDSSSKDSEEVGETIVELPVVPSATSGSESIQASQTSASQGSGSGTTKLGDGCALLFLAYRNANGILKGLLFIEWLKCKFGRGTASN